MSNKTDHLFSASELNECIEEYIYKALEDDPEQLQRDMDHMMKVMAKSSRARSAIETATEHIKEHGPGHIGCGVKQAAAAFFLVGLRLAEKRFKDKGAIDELERLMGLSAPEAL